MATYHIEKRHLALVDKKLGKVNRKAKKLGTAAIGYEIVKEYQKKISGSKYSTFVAVETTDPEVKINGWDFAASKEKAETGKAYLIFKKPGFNAEIPEQYRTMAGFCEHCKTSRLRKNLYILANEAGEFKQVGSTCIVDFLGHPSALQILRLYSRGSIEAPFQAEGEKSLLNPTEYNYSLEQVLTLAAADILQRGYHKSNADEFGGESTKNRVLYWLELPTACSWFQSPSDWKLEMEKMEAAITDRAKEVGAAAVQFGANMGARSDFAHNISTLCQGSHISGKSIGLAAWIPAGYLKDEAKKIETSTAGAHVGTIGERTSMDLIYKETIGFNNDWGTCLIKFTDTAGNPVSWFTAKDIDLKPGEQVTAKLTVKKHETYRGQAQTVVTRLAIQ